MQKREAQQLIKMLGDGKVESVLYLLRGVVSDYEDEQAAAKERECEFGDSCSCPECEDAKDGE